MNRANTVYRGNWSLKIFEPNVEVLGGWGGSPWLSSRFRGYLVFVRTWAGDKFGDSGSQTVVLVSVQAWLRFLSRLAFSDWYFST